MKRECIQGLWIGRRLSLMERLSIRSFLAQGHPYHLYVYGPVQGVPKGVVVRDAKTILPRSRLFRIARGKGRGSLASFSNLFRYKLLSQRGGWWVDLDVVCLRPFEFPTPYVFALERTPQGDTRVCPGILKVPKGCAFIRRCYEQAASRDPARVRFGETGALLLEPILRAHRLALYAQPPRVFCPLDWWAFHWAIDPAIRFPLESSSAVHLWNELWRRRGLSKDGSYDPACLYEHLRVRYRVRRTAR